MALHLIVAMALTPAPPADDERPFARFGFAGKGAALALAWVIVFLLTLWAMANAMRHFAADDVLPYILLFVMKNGYWPQVLTPYICLAFVVLLAWCVIKSRRRTDTPRGV